jgi:xylulokinase
MYLAMTQNRFSVEMLRWFQDEFCEPHMEEAARTGEDVYDLILRGAPDGPTDLIFLPPFSEGDSPPIDCLSEGALLGLNHKIRRADVAKAIFEGLTYELRNKLDLIKFGGAKINVLHPVRGEVKSSILMQLMADITGIPVSVPHITEVSGIGAAILAGIGADIYPDAVQATQRVLRFEKYLQPQPGLVAAYQSCFDEYQQLYPSIKELSHRM